MSHNEPFAPYGAQRLTERRASVRRRTLLKGKIVYPHNSFSADCVIRDLSDTGARVVVSPSAITTDPFLVVVKEAVVHESVTAWTSGDQLGLRFNKTINLSQDVPAHLNPIRKVWVELMPR